jgi:hypothetical protein
MTVTKAERTARSCLGGNVSTSVRVAVEPAIEFAVGRRPYIVERKGSLIVRLSKLLKPGGLTSFSARLERSGVALFGVDVSAPQRRQPPLPPPGTTTAIAFDLSVLPPSVTDHVVLSVTCGQHKISKSKLFLRVPRPPANHGGSVWQVDHEHRSVIKNTWQQFLGVGWFNTPFNENYYNGGRGDPSYWTGPQTSRGVGPLSGYTQAGDLAMHCHWLLAAALRSSAVARAVRKARFQQIDRGSGPRPGDRFLLTIPECMHNIDSRWTLLYTTTVDARAVPPPHRSYSIRLRFAISAQLLLRGSGEISAAKYYEAILRGRSRPPAPCVQLTFAAHSIHSQ